MGNAVNDVRIAMLGSGFVAGFYLQGLANVAGQRVVANYSRSRERDRGEASSPPEYRRFGFDAPRRRC